MDLPAIAADILCVLLFYNYLCIGVFVGVIEEKSALIARIMCVVIWPGVVILTGYELLKKLEAANTTPVDDRRNTPEHIPDQ